MLLRLFFGHYFNSRTIQPSGLDLGLLSRVVELIPFDESEVNFLRDNSLHLGATLTFKRNCKVLLYRFLTLVKSVYPLQFYRTNVIFSP